MPTYSVGSGLDFETLNVAKASAVDGDIFEIDGSQSFLSAALDWDVPNCIFRAATGSECVLTSFNTSKAHASVSAASGYALTFSATGCTLQDVSIRNTASNAYGTVTTVGAGVGVRLLRCRIEDDPAGGALYNYLFISDAAGNGHIEAHQCVFLIHGAGGFRIQNTYTFEILDCLFVNLGTSTGGIAHPSFDGGCTGYLHNNFIYIADGAVSVATDVGSATITASHNATNKADIGPVGGASNLLNRVLATELTDAANGDLTKAGTSTLAVSGTGTALTSYGITTDWDGNAYNTDWTIGPQGTTPPPTPAEISVTGAGGTVIADGDTTPTTGDGTDFESVTVGDTLDQQFTIHNTGETTLNLSGTPIVAISGSSTFTVSSQPSSTTIAAGGSLPFTVRFTPTSLDAQTATVSIANDDSDENPYTFNVTGSGRTGGFDMSDSERVLLAVAEESVFGTAPTGGGSVYDYLPFTSESLAQVTSVKESDTIVGDRQTRGLRRMGLGVSGAVNFEMIYGAHDQLLAALMMSTWQAAVVAASDDTGVSVTASTKTFTHATGWDNNPTAGEWIKVSGFTTATNNGIFKVVSVTNTTIVVEGATLTDEAAGDTINIVQGAKIVNGSTSTPLTFEKKFQDLSNTYHYFTGVMVDQLQLNLRTEEFVTGSFSVNGRQQYTNTADLGETYTAVPTTESMTSVEDVIGVLKNGVEFTVTSFNMTVNNNVRNRKVVGDLADVSKGLGRFGVSGSFAAYFADQTFVDAHVDFTSLGLAFVLTDPDGNSYVVDMPEAKVTKSDTPTSGRDTDVMINCDFQSYREETENITLRIVRFPVA